MNISSILSMGNGNIYKSQLKANANETETAPPTAIERPLGLAGSNEDYLFQINKLVASGTAASLRINMQTSSTVEILAYLKAEAVSIDYSGMTDGEIYGSIFNRYAEYFGDDFLDSKFELRGDSTEIALAQGQYFGEIHTQFTNRDTLNAAYAEFHGYGGMTDEEMKSAIINKYSENMTNRDYFHMIYEFSHTGLMNRELSYEYLFITQERMCAYGGMSSDKITKQPGYNAEAYYQTLINQPTSFNDKFNDFKEMVRTVTVANGKAGIDRFRQLTLGIYDFFTSMFNLEDKNLYSEILKIGGKNEK